MNIQYDLIVIGAGPGGYVAAIQAAKLGLSVALVEEDRVGGTCLNRGCIPAKTMLHASALYQEAKQAARFGVNTSAITYDYSKILTYKQATSDNLVQGIEQLLKANGVTRISGSGTLLPGNQVQISGETPCVLEGKNILLATGSVPAMLPIPGMELPGVLTSDELFQLEQAPESLVIIGGGVISVEFATVFAALDCKVTILEALPRLLPNMDKEIGQNLKMILKKRGVDIHTSASVQGIAQGDGELICTFTEKDKEYTARGQYVLCAVGRRANTRGLFVPAYTPELNRGRVVVDDHFATSLPGVYAIGDLIGGAQLAHAASAQGMAVARQLAGQTSTSDTGLVPGCVYTNPEIATVGLNEETAKAAGIPAEVGKFIMSANGKSLITQEERGFIKILAHRDTHVILGAQLMCARATDMIGELVTAVANEMTVPQLLKGMRAHPTYNEGIGEALEELEGGAIHTAPRKRGRAASAG